MPALTRLEDKNTGHDACPPAPLTEASKNVFVNGKGAGRLDDKYAPHGCDDHSPHSGIISEGSSTVFINDKPAGRLGDAVSCGGEVAEGSQNVFVGG